MAESTRHNFLFKLRGLQHEVDADNLSVIISCLSDMVRHIQKLGYPDSSSNILIKANRAGSFEIESIIALTLAPNLIPNFFQGASSIEGAKYIFECIIAAFEIKNHLKESPDFLTNMQNTQSGFGLVNNHGTVLNVQNVFLGRDFLEDPSLDGFVSRICGAIIDDNKDGFSISDSRNTHEFTKDQCVRMSSPVIELPLSDQESTETRRATILIRKPDLIGNTKWDIVYLGSTVKARMLDKSFLSRLHEGLVKVSNETKIDVTLKVKIFLDRKKKVTVGEYEILEVHD